MSCRPAGMGWGWGENLRGWGGDGDEPCGDGVEMGKTYLLRGGDGEEIVSPRHSLLCSSCYTLTVYHSIRKLDGGVLNESIDCPVVDIGHLIFYLRRPGSPQKCPTHDYLDYTCLFSSSKPTRIQ